MASRVTVKIGSGEGPWVALNAQEHWRWEVINPLGAKVFAEYRDARDQLHVVEVYNNHELEPGIERVRVKAANATAALIVTLVRIEDAPATD